MDKINKQQLNFFKTIIKEVLEFEKNSKIEKEQRDKIRKEEMRIIKCIESKKKFKPKLQEIISEIKDKLYYEDTYKEDIYSCSDLEYDTYTFIRDSGGFGELKLQISKLIEDYSKSIIDKKL